MWQLSQAIENMHIDVTSFTLSCMPEVFHVNSHQSNLESTKESETLQILPSGVLPA